MKKLIEVQSLHEQRELFGNPDIIIEPGVWLEVLEFNIETEQVNIKHRWQVEKVEKTQKGDIKKYRVICGNLDIKSYEEKKKLLAKQVLEKHKKKLKASFAKCLIDGISTKTTADLKLMLNKLGGSNDDKQEDS